jgi:hypothetical protein
MRKLTRQDKGRDNNRGTYMATDPIQIGGITWPNQFQKPTGIVAGAANPAMDPQNLNNSRIPADSAKVPYAAKGIDTVPSTDSTQGRIIDVRV